MKNRIIYLCFLGSTILGYLMWDSEYSRFALGITIMIAVLLFIQTLYMKSKITAYLQLKEKLVTRGDAIEVSVVVKNSGSLPVARVRAKLRYKEEGCAYYKTAIVYGVVESRGEVSIEACLKCSHCNVVEVYLEKVQVNDCFGIFAGKCKNESNHKEVYILPWTNVPMAETLSQAGDFAGKYGEDVYETYNIREFRDGDDIRQIHWKLTAKVDMLLLREYLKTSESGVMIYLDFSKEKEKEYDACQLDAFLDKASSLSWEILRWGVSHYVAGNKTEEEFVVFIETEENFIEYQMMLIQTVVCHRRSDTDLYKEKVVNEEKVHTICMDLEGKVSWEEFAGEVT